MDEIQESSAIISECGKYRYLLKRIWNPSGIRALFIMLNPSTADHEKDDPTIRSCIRLTKGLQFGGFDVVNLFAYRATDPIELYEVDDPVGPRNDVIIEAAINRNDIIIGAWGAQDIALDRKDQVQRLVRASRPAIFSFGCTKSGAPKHPLYIKNGAVLQAYA